MEDLLRARLSDLGQGKAIGMERKRYIEDKFSRTHFDILSLDGPYLKCRG
jgi:hypothetical protein